MPNKNIRASLIGQVIHQIPGQNPSSFSIKSHQTLSEEEQPYIRTPKPLGHDWVKVDTGWLPQCSLLAIKNLKEPKEDSDEGLIQLGAKGKPFPLRIPPGMTTVIYPTEDLYLCCLNGSAHYTIFALPR